jgi:hypothetical protein
MIQITDDLRIVTSPMNYQIQEYRKKNDKTWAWKGINSGGGYYGMDLGHALQGVADILIQRDVQVGFDLKSITEHLNAIQERILKAVEGVRFEHKGGKDV